MSTTTETSDARVLDLLRKSGPLAVAQLSRFTGVTATAVRQRLVRLIGQGLIERETVRQIRGRPSHRYFLTEKARRQAGSNFADLAVTLWKEIRAVKDPDIRRGLFQRLAKSMAALYAGQISGATVGERMQSLAQLLGDRGVAFEVKTSGSLPVLTAIDCPYPELAEHDRGICAVEKMMLAELFDEDVRLAQCRFDGHACCEFVTS